MSKQSVSPYIRHGEATPSKSNGVVSKQKRTYLWESSKATYFNSHRAGNKTVYKSAEYMTSSTVRVANNRGYTEYYKQQKVTRSIVYYATATSGSGTKYGGVGAGAGAKKYLR